MKAASIVAACCALSIALAHAADIYEWVDDQGRTHVSDTVPDRYKGRARKIDSRSTEVTPQQRAEAEARAAKDRAKAQESQNEADAARNRSRDDSADGAHAPASAAPANQPDDCPTLRKLYRESQECFAPFKRVDGTIDPQAFQKCTELPDPSAKCGIPTTPR